MDLVRSERMYLEWLGENELEIKKIREALKDLTDEEIVRVIRGVRGAFHLTLFHFPGRNFFP
jgi:hypothetical protein